MRRLHLALLRSLPLVALLAQPARADLITGQVKNSAGVPVANVNIDAKNLVTGDDVTLVNDGTDANGFFATTIPPGQYRITFVPPPPPATKSLVLEVEPVVVVGTKAMGVLTLPPGVLLAGHVQNASAFPVPNVNVDLVDLDTGDELIVPDDLTDGLGNFLVVAPLGAVELRLDATGVSGQTLASKQLQLVLAGDTSVGNVTLPPGFHVIGTVQTGQGDPVVGADTDSADSATGSEWYTPHDNTDDNGVFDVVLPAGTFDLEICPQFADHLVAKEVLGFAVGGATNLGTIALGAGFVLSGTVKNGAGAGLPNVDVDARFSASGIAVPLCNDNTASNGTFAVIVPAGTFIVTFTPPYSLPYASQVVTGVVVAGNKLQNGTLPDCPFNTPYGSGLSGSGGFVPVLGSTGGAPRMGNPDWTILISKGLGGKPCTVLIGFAPASLPFKQGTLLVNIASFPYLSLTLPLSGPLNAPGAGAFSLPAPAPTAPMFIGLTWYAQAFVPDAGAPAGIAMSNGMHVTYLP